MTSIHHTCGAARYFPRLKLSWDDLSLKYLEPEAYYDLVEKIALRKDAREKYVQDIVDEVTEHITDAGI